MANRTLSPAVVLAMPYEYDFIFYERDSSEEEAVRISISKFVFDVFQAYKYACMVFLRFYKGEGDVAVFYGSPAIFYATLTSGGLRSIRRNLPKQWYEYVQTNKCYQMRTLPDNIQLPYVIADGYEEENEVYRIVFCTSVGVCLSPAYTMDEVKAWFVKRGRTPHQKLESL